MPFIALLGATLQTAFMIWASQNLDDALRQTVRSILTGEFQQANSGQTNTATLLATLQTNMCGAPGSPISTVFNCPGVKLDVRLGTNFTSSSPTSPIDPTTRNWASGFGTNYTCAPPGSIVIVTAAVKFPVFFGLWNPLLSNFTDGSKLLQSTSVFRTEPYDSSSTPAC